MDEKCEITLDSGEQFVSANESEESYFTLTDNEHKIVIDFFFEFDSGKLSIRYEYDTGEMTPDFDITIEIKNHYDASNPIRRNFKKNFKHIRADSFDFPAKISESKGYIQNGIITLKIKLKLIDNVTIRSQPSSTVVSRLNSPTIQKQEPNNEPNLAELQQNIPILKLDIPKAPENTQTHKPVLLKMESESDSDVVELEFTQSKSNPKKEQQFFTSETDSVEEIITVTDSSIDQRIASFSGLVNQGSTCYINVWLQVLYHIPMFRSFIFKNHEDTQCRLFLSIRRLFYLMTIHNNQSQSTKDLTKSFGWESDDILVQHDTHEFFTIFIDTLPKSIQNCAKYLFNGKTRQIITRKDNDKVILNETEESFTTISLDVSQSDTLKESLENFSKTQTLSGDEQYKTMSNEKIDVNVKTNIEVFPRVLIIHLARFKFDASNLTMSKINSPFQFDDNFTISNNEYTLYGVIVHSGTPNSGHYYTYIRPDLQNKNSDFVLFNDTDVKYVSKSEAIENNFGGNNYSAYILVYVMKEFINELFFPVDVNEASQSVTDEVIDIKIYRESNLENAARTGYMSYLLGDPLMIHIGMSAKVGSIPIKADIESKNLRYFCLENENYLNKELGADDVVSLLENSKGVFIIESDPNSSIYPVFIYDYHYKCPLRLFKFCKLSDYEMKVSELISSLITVDKPEEVNLSASTSKLSCRTLIASQKLKDCSLLNGTILILSSKTQKFSLDENIENNFSDEDKNKFVPYKEYPVKFNGFLSVMRESDRIRIVINDVAKDIWLSPESTFDNFYNCIMKYFPNVEISKAKTNLLFYQNNSMNAISWKFEDRVQKVLPKAKFYTVFPVDNISFALTDSIFRVKVIIVDGPNIEKSHDLLVNSHFTTDDLIKECAMRGIISGAYQYSIIYMEDNILSFATHSILVAGRINPFRLTRMSQNYEIVTVFSFIRDRGSLRENEKEVPFAIEIRPSDTFSMLRGLLSEKYKYDCSGCRFYKCTFGYIGNFEVTPVNVEDSIMRVLDIKRERVGIEKIVNNSLKLQAL